MNLEKSLYQRSYIYFILFFILMLWGFWVTYFTRLLDQENYRMHLHGMALVFWCLMLIIQPYLLRTQRVDIHRKTGKLSYLLVPFLIWSTLDLLKYKLRDVEILNNSYCFFIALVINALVAFMIFYGLAIYHRRQGPLHGRYMLCTAFPFFTPITDRIISIFFPSLMQFVPSLDFEPLVPVIGFLIADVILIFLCIWDWRSHKRYDIFPFALFVLLAYHFSVLNFYKYEFWKSFCMWFIKI